MTDQNPRFQLLLKEIELINDNIKNLDDIIYKMKNFAFLIWGGALYLIAEHLGAPNRKHTPETIQTLLALTAFAPFVFWMIHVRWQKHISMTGQRERMISYFLNSSSFDNWLAGDKNVNFPLYDLPGWIYTHDALPIVENEKPIWEKHGAMVDSNYLLNHENISIWKLMWYKDAAWYYPVMILISIGFALLY